MGAEYPTAEELEFHPIANLFPLMEGEEFEALVEDIRWNGQQIPIGLYEGKILDGRNRYLALRQLEVLPYVEGIETEDPVGYVVSRNLHRRHLTPSQRAVIAILSNELVDQLKQEAAARRAQGNLEGGIHRHNPPDPGPEPIRAGPEGKVAAQLGKLFGVGTTTIERAQKVAREAPDEMESIKAGKQTIDHAWRNLGQPEPEIQSEPMLAQETVRHITKEVIDSCRKLPSYDAKIIAAQILSQPKQKRESLQRIQRALLWLQRLEELIQD